MNDDMKNATETDYNNTLDLKRYDCLDNIKWFLVIMRLYFLNTLKI